MADNLANENRKQMIKYCWKSEMPSGNEINRAVPEHTYGGAGGGGEYV
jgi:hypothetical protein